MAVNNSLAKKPAKMGLTAYLSQDAVKKQINNVVVTIAFKPNAERNFVATGVQTKTTLAPALGAVTAFSMGKNLQTGEVEAIEMGNQIPGQMSVNDVPGVVPENVVEVEGKAVDTDTGEIVGTAGSKVVDLRRREA